MNEVVKLLDEYITAKESERIEIQTELKNHGVTKDLLITIGALDIKRAILRAENDQNNIEIDSILKEIGR